LRLIFPEELRYAGRTRRPTMDRFSAILNFGYALLQTAVMRAILAAGLEPALGFYHTPRSAGASAGAGRDGAVPCSAGGHDRDRIPQPRPGGTHAMILPSPAPRSG